MSDLAAYEKIFLETLGALGQDQLDQLIVFGGWCPYLYAKYLWKKDAPFLRTVDIDFAVVNPNTKKLSFRRSGHFLSGRTVDSDHPISRKKSSSAIRKSLRLSYPEGADH